MKRFFTLYIPPLLGLIIVIIKIPGVEEWFKNHYVHATFILALILVGCGILNHFITVISPFKKYERIEKNKWSILDEIAKNFLHEEIMPDKKILVNIMLPKRVLFSNLEPKGDSPFWNLNKLLKKLFRIVLYVEWSSNNHAVHKKIKLLTNQGASGFAYTRGQAVIIDIPKKKDSLNLNEQQLSAISGQGFIISYPIFSFDERYSRLNNKKIIGVVNFSCSILGAETLISSEKNREKLTSKIVEFSKTCSLIL